MSAMNKRNLVYFEHPSMRGLYDRMDEWQQLNNRRLLSISIQQDQGSYCCIALTNPTEVVITSADGKRHADITISGLAFPDDGWLQTKIMLAADLTSDLPRCYSLVRSSRQR